MSIDSELSELRKRLVTLSISHSVSIETLLRRYVLITEEELGQVAKKSIESSGGSGRQRSPRAAGASAAAATGVSFNLPQAPNVRISSFSDNARSTSDNGSLETSMASQMSTVSSRRGNRSRSIVARMPVNNGAGVTEVLEDDFDEPRKSTLTTVEMQRFATQAMSFSVRKSETKSLFRLVENTDFGIEIETLLAKRADEFLTDNSVKAIRDVAPQLNSKLGTGFHFKFFQYDDAKQDREYSIWKITTDLSIKPEDGRPIFGLEFVTPKLSGPVGLNKVEQVCDALQSIGCATNNTTALHVHVSCQRLTNEQIRRFTSFALFYEPIVDQFMTLQRRADYSRYCRSNLKSATLSRHPGEGVKLVEAVDVSKSLDVLLHLVCPKLSPIKNSARNHKINFILLKGTKMGHSERRLEFRQHQGTCDKTEVSAWTALLINFVKKGSMSDKPPTDLEENPTWDGFWRFIADDDLRIFFTVKKETLPERVDFTYDSRELLAYDDAADDSEEDVADDEDTVGASSSTQPQSAAEVPLPAPVPVPPVAAREQTNPRVVSINVEAPVIDVGHITESDDRKNSNMSLSSSAGPGGNSQVRSTSGDSPYSGSTSLSSLGFSENQRAASVFGASTNSGRNASIEPSMFTLSDFRTQYRAVTSGPEGDGGGAGRDRRRSTTNWDIAKDIATVSKFQLPSPLFMELEFMDEGASADDLLGHLKQVAAIGGVPLGDSTNPTRSMTEWEITTPNAASRFVRTTRGLRVATPLVKRSRDLSFMNDVFEGMNNQGVSPGVARCFYSVFIGKMTPLQHRRLLEGILLFDAALTSILNSDSIVPSKLMMASMDARKRTHNDMLQLVRSVAGDCSDAVSSPLSSDKLVQVLNPPELVNEKDRPLAVDFGRFRKQKVITFDGGSGTGRQLVIRGVFIAYFVAHCVELSDKELYEAAQVASMFGPVQAATLRGKLENAPEFVKNSA